MRREIMGLSSKCGLEIERIEVTVACPSDIPKGYSKITKDIPPSTMAECMVVALVGITSAIPHLRHKISDLRLH
jgi:hypothetical protein